MISRIREKLNTFLNKQADDYCYAVDIDINKSNDINLKTEGNVTKLDINEDINFIECMRNIKELDEYDPNFDIMFNVILYDDPNVMEANATEQCVLIYDDDDYHVAFSKDSNRIKILEFKYIDDKIYENCLLIDHGTNDFHIHQLIHSNKSTISVKTYTKSNDNDSILFLPKVEAFSIAKDILKNTSKLSDIQDFRNFMQDFDLIYQSLNLINDNSYFPVIRDDVLSLSWRNKFLQEDINKCKDVSFDVILNSTREKVGRINLDYLCKSGFTYSGNVSYHINKDYRNNNYATRAVGLLVNVSKDNEFDGDRNLYISTLPDNYASQKVALNNDAELCYDGEVPKDNSVYFIDGVEKVKVYRIKM